MCRLMQSLSAELSALLCYMHRCGTVMDVFSSLALDALHVAGFARRVGRVSCCAVVKQSSLRLTARRAKMNMVLAFTLELDPNTS